MEVTSDNSILFAKGEIKQLAALVGKSLTGALRNLGDEIASAYVKNMEDDAFTLKIIYKNQNTKEYPFKVTPDNKLVISLQDTDYPLGDVSKLPSGKPILRKDLISSEMVKLFKQFALREGFIRDLIEECFYEVLSEAQDSLATTSQQIITKFPELKKTLSALMTEDFESFIKEVQHIAPRPSTFRVVLKNGQDFLLKYSGKFGFVANIEGKRYDLDSVSGFQQAIDKLGILFKDAPFVDDDELDQEGEEGFDEFDASDNLSDEEPDTAEDDFEDSV